MSPLALHPIGILHTPFKQRFTIPRQAGLVKEIRASLAPLPPYDRAEAWLGIEAYSHLWLLVYFHATHRDDWQPTVRPPRLGGNRRIGVFASRSNFRPNPIGLSLLRLGDIESQAGKVRLELFGGDLLDGTPVLDVKPYIPYADSQAEARADLAPAAPLAPFRVAFAPAAEAAIAARAGEIPELRAVLQALLALDPRPAYTAAQAQSTQADKVFATRLYDFNLRWRIVDDVAWVLALEPLPSDH